MLPEMRRADSSSTPMRRGNGLDLEVDGAHGAVAGAVGVELRESLAGFERGHHGSGHVVGCRGPEIERGGRIAVHVDAAGEVIAGFGGALVVLQQGLEEDDEDGLGRERRLVEDLDVELAGSSACLSR